MPTRTRSKDLRPRTSSEGCCRGESSIPSAGSVMPPDGPPLPPPCARPSLRPPPASAGWRLAPRPGLRRRAPLSPVLGPPGLGSPSLPHHTSDTKEAKQGPGERNPDREGGAGARRRPTAERERGPADRRRGGAARINYLLGVVHTRGPLAPS